MAKKGLIIGLSVGSVVVGVLVLMFFMGVFDDLFKKKSKPRVNYKRGGYCGKLKVKEGHMGHMGHMGPDKKIIDKYLPYLKDNKLHQLDLTGKILDYDIDGKITVNGHVMTFSSDNDHTEIDIKNKTRNNNGKIEYYTDVYYNKSLNRIILLKEDDDDDGIDISISSGIDGSYFNC